MALLVAVAVTACVSESASERPRVRVGMSREDLRLYFGQPLRIEPASSGGENWYYSFVSWSSPQVEATRPGDSLDPDISSVSLSVSSSRGEQERPVHLSADGYVTEPIPEGKLVRK
jgi:hypothetical protein